jgi:hypothetical protein
MKGMANVAEPFVAIVGVCAAGKSTLMQGLNRIGIKAVSVPQEHSVVRRLWERLHPESNVLVVLDAEHATTKRRRPLITYGPERLEEQRRRLAPALAEADLYVATDDLDVDQVRELVAEWVGAWRERSS